MSADQEYFLTLPPEFRQALGICGIHGGAALAHADIDTLWKDLKKAHDFFPLDVSVYSREQLEALLAPLKNARADGLFAEGASGFGEGGTHLPPYKAQKRIFHAPSKDETGEKSVLFPGEKDLPGGVPFPTDGKEAPRPAEHDHPVRNSRIFRVFFCALATLLFPAALIGLLYGGGSFLFQGCKMTIPLVVLLSASGGVILLYLALLNQAICSVCKMPLFTFRSFARNRKAPRWPLLGHSITAAIYTLFAHSFRCPACATLQRLKPAGHRRKSGMSKPTSRS